ncbi:MAG: tyrosine-protein phosphatase [bacterium]|nr:tyrosine-protein phosphatase [bacterium]
MRDRTPVLDGAVNLRDFGGYATTDGRRVKRRKLYRSGTLAHLSDEGREAFEALEVGLICDLRRSEERIEEPTPFPPDAPRRAEISIDPGSAVGLRESLADGVLDLGFEERIGFMVGINRELARDHIDDYARMFEYLVEMQEGAFLVHCSAGKDRTGFACALVLHALGVPEETVFEDYLLTNEVMDYEGFILPRVLARYDQKEVPERESIMALAGVRPEYLKAAYDAIEAEFNDVEHYIEQALGLDAATRERLRARLLE